MHNWHLKQVNFFRKLNQYKYIDIATKFGFKQTITFFLSLKKKNLEKKPEVVRLRRDTWDIWHKFVNDGESTMAGNRSAVVTRWLPRRLSFLPPHPDLTGEEVGVGRCVGGGGGQLWETTRLSRHLKLCWLHVSLRQDVSTGAPPRPPTYHPHKSSWMTSRKATNRK